MRQLLDEAAAGAYGVGAFNVNNMEQIQAIMEAARETASPVIVQASRGARAYTNDRFLWHLMQAAVELYPEIPVALHLDHGNEPATCISAIELGFTSVMMDGSLEADGKTPASFDYNVAVTKEVVEHAHARGVTVEGELGTLGGIEDGHGSGEVHITDPDEAVEFVAATGIDALAVAIGTSHGAYKFSQAPDGEVLKMSVIEEIHERLPETHLVMHGSSSVPPELVERVNRYGGDAEACVGRAGQGDPAGDPPRRPQDQRRHRLASRCDGRDPAGLRRVPDKFDPRDYLKPARAAMQELIAERMRDFGQAGHAGDYEPLALAEMRERYAAAAA